MSSVAREREREERERERERDLYVYIYIYMYIYIYICASAYRAVGTSALLSSWLYRGIYQISGWISAPFFRKPQRGPCWFRSMVGELVGVRRQFSYPLLKNFRMELTNHARRGTMGNR